MCVNDILTCGAKPIFFLDYMAAGRLREEEVVNILKGIVQGCKIAGCALLGGETAEMPGFYKDGDYDLSGFAVGIVDRKKLISGHNIVPGDTIIGLASSGLHSNGYSLVRKIFLSEGESSLNKNVPSLNLSLGEELLKPTRIYVSTILNLLKEFKIKGIAHITGGGFIDNIPRILPANVAITINRDNWPILPIFKLIEEKGNITLSEMFHIFNMGIGLVLVVAKEDEEAVLAGLLQLQEQAYIIGKAKVRTETNRAIYIN